MGNIEEKERKLNETITRVNKTLSVIIFREEDVFVSLQNPSPLVSAMPNEPISDFFALKKDFEVHRF